MKLDLKKIFYKYDQQTQDQIDACAAAEGKERYEYMAELLRDALDALSRENESDNQTRH